MTQSNDGKQDLSAESYAKWDTYTCPDCQEQVPMTDSMHPFKHKEASRTTELELCNCDGFWHVECPDGITRYISEKSFTEAVHQEAARLANPANVDRFEVIDDTGRAYVKGDIYGSPVSVELSYQDEGRTLKVFVTDRDSQKPTLHDIASPNPSPAANKAIQTAMEESAKRMELDSR